MTEMLTHERNGEPAATPANVRACIAVFLTAALVYVLFGSGDMVSMAYDLSEAFPTGPLVPLAEGWHGLMEQAGTAGFAQAVRDAVAQLRAPGWGG